MAEEWTSGRPLIIGAMQPIIDALSAAGLRVFVDVKDINPPCAFLHPPELAFRFRAGDFTATFTLLLVVVNKDRTAAYVDLSHLIEQAQAALGDRAVTARPTEVDTSDMSAALSAYELQWTERIRQRG